MDAFDGLGQPLCDYNDSMDGLPELWESNSFDSGAMALELRETDDHFQQSSWPTGLGLSLISIAGEDSDDDLTASRTSMVVLHDRLITDTSTSSAEGFDVGKTCSSLKKNYHGTQNASLLLCSSPTVSHGSEGGHGPFISTVGSRHEAELSEEMRSPGELIDHFCDPKSLNIKTEPISPKPSEPVIIDAVENDVIFAQFESRKRPAPASDVRCVRDCQGIKVKPTNAVGTRLVISRTSIPSTTARKAENFMLPPTPPSSSPSDNEGSLSPMRDAASPKLETIDEVNERKLKSGTRVSFTAKPSIDQIANVSNRHPINSPLISYQPKGSTGTLHLTEEEKRTLLAEGYPVPTRLPLTKAEEKSLKKIRRKIKNKISAQESRRKKKEYMDTLERRSNVLVDENHDYRQRVQKLEAENAALQIKLSRLQQLLEKNSDNRDIKCHLIEELQVSSEDIMEFSSSVIHF